MKLKMDGIKMPFFRDDTISFSRDLPTPCFLYSVKNFTRKSQFPYGMKKKGGEEIG